MKQPAVHFSDLHLDNYTVGSKLPGDRLEDCLQVIDDVFRHAAAIHAEYITFGGDWNNTPKFIATLVENQAMARLAHWFSIYPNIQILAISGNHDFATKNLFGNEAATSIEPLSYAFPNNFKIIDNSGVCVGRKGMVYGIPYYEYAEHYEKALDAVVQLVKQDKEAGGMKATLLIHQTPNGIGNTNIKADTDVQDSRYDNFDLVLCGHIHIRQHITNKFVLAGNPLHKDLSDAGLEKGFWEYDLEDPVNTLKFISRKGKYPEFTRQKEGYKAPKDSRDIVTIIPEEVSIVLDERAAIEDFGSGLSTEKLLTNYWKAVDGKDEKLLQVGLSLLGVK